MAPPNIVINDLERDKVSHFSFLGVGTWIFCTFNFFVNYVQIGEIEDCVMDGWQDGSFQLYANVQFMYDKITKAFQKRIQHLMLV